MVVYHGQSAGGGSSSGTPPPANPKSRIEPESPPPSGGEGDGDGDSDDSEPSDDGAPGDGDAGEGEDDDGAEGPTAEELAAMLGDEEEVENNGEAEAESKEESKNDSKNKPEKNGGESEDQASIGMIPRLNDESGGGEGNGKKGKNMRTKKQHEIDFDCTEGLNNKPCPTCAAAIKAAGF